MNYNVDDRIYKTGISILFGLSSLIIDFFPIKISFSEFNLYIFLGLIFPMIVAMSWGTIYGLISISFDIIPIIYIYHDISLILLFMPVSVIWIAYHGYIASIYRKNKSLFFTPYIAEIFFRFIAIISIYIILLLISQVMILLNKGNLIQLINIFSSNIVKTIFNSFIIIIISDILLKIPFVKKIFKIDNIYQLTLPKSIIIITFVSGILFWLVDSIVDYLFIYYQNNSIYDVIILNNFSLFESYKRIFIIIIIYTAGFIISLTVQQYKSAQENYKNILNKMYDGFAVMSKTGLLTFVNDSLCKMLEYNSSELLNKSILDFLDDKNKSILMDQIKLRRLGEVKPYEIIFETKNNKKITTLVTPQLLFDSKDKFIESFAVIRNITDIKISEEQLKESEEKFRYLADQSPSMILIYNDRKIFYVNNKVIEETGYSYDELTSDHFNFFDLLTEENRAIAKENIRLRLQGKILEPVEYKMLTKQGKIIDIIVTAKTMNYKNENVIIGVFTDITERKKIEKELKESEEKFRILAEKSPNVIFIVTRNKILYVNNMFVELLGYSKKEVYSSGFNIFKLFPNESYNEYKKNFLGRFDENSENFESVEYKLINKNGKILYALISSQVIKFNNIDAVLYVATDITERKKMEMAIKESDEKFRTLAEESPNIIFINKNNKIVYINKKCEELLGYTRDEIYSPDFDFLKLFTKESADRVKKNIELRNQGFDIPTTNYSTVSKTGKVNENIVTTKLINYEGDKALLGIVTDINNITIALDELKKSEERYKTITNAITDYIYRVKIKNNQVIETTHGPACHAITGYTPEEFNKDKYLWFRMVHDDDRDLVNKQIENLIKGEKVQPIEHRIINKAGQVKWIKNSIVPFYDNEGKLFAYDGIIHDITDKKNAESEKEKLNEALININAELENLVYVTSHDLRSPLINIQGFSRELEKSLKSLLELYEKNEDIESNRNKIEDIINKEINAYFNYIDISVKKMDQLLSSLLKYSRVNKANLEITKINMNEVINSIIENMKYMIQTQDIIIKVDNLPDCMGDINQLSQAFSNLIDNSIKYKDPSRQCIIHIYGYTKNNESIYCIKDNGIGIEAIHQKRIFDIFFRSHRNQNMSGEGLGLTIVLKIINKHKGKIWLESEPNVGTTFFISLPSFL
jgi:PAS domain S-box-containing protein